MIRALVVVILVAGGARAEPKPTLAVVIDPKDPGAIAGVDALSAQLRKLAGGKAEHYAAKGTAKQITAVTRGAECKAIEPPCAIKIGAALGVDYVITGEVETRGTHLVLVAGLVNVATKQRVRSLRDIVEKSVATKVWAQKVYERLVGEDTGELQISSNAQRGDVLVDGQVVGALFEGRVTLTGLAGGTHQLGVRAPGYRALDIDVTIEGKTRENLLLERTP